MSPHNDLDLEESKSNSLHGIPAQDDAPPQQICCKRLSGSEDAEQNPDTVIWTR